MGALPRQVGRYVVLGSIDADRVLHAYDPQQHREVDLVFLPASESSRVLAEAPSLIRPTHPNLVAVLDVDTHDGRPFLVTQHVEGERFAAWASTRRAWREVLEVLLAAGRGLAAAHDAGVFHRDFRLGHVIIDGDARVRVTALGVADTDSIGAAPELGGGASPDARSDLFAFCVAAWEGIHGNPPFVGSPEEIAEAKATHRLPRGDGPAPAWLQRELVRGLSPTPDARHANMAALLRALGRDRTRAQARRIATIGGVAGISIVGVWGGREIIHGQRIAACQERGAEIDRVWNADARDSLEVGLRSSGVVDAPFLVAGASRYLDDFRAQWHDGRARACVDAEVDMTIDRQIYAQVLWCLDDRRLALEALLAEFDRPDRAAAYHLLSVAAGLSSPSSCLRPSAGARLPALPADAERSHLREVRAQLQRAAAQDGTGRVDAGLEVAQLVLADADAIGWAPLMSAAAHRVCHLQVLLDQLEPAHEACLRAYYDAAFAGQNDLAADAAIELVDVAGVRLGRVEEGRAWARHAEVAMALLAEDDPSRAVRWLVHRGALSRRAGLQAGARSDHGEALALAERSFGPEHPRLLGILDELALDLEAQGDAPAAATMRTRAVAIAEAAFGRDHPDVAASLVQKGRLEQRQGAAGQARADFTRALSILDAAFGPGDVAPARAAAARALLEVGGDHDAAVDLTATTTAEVDTANHR